jgi:hypothetical protein
MRSNRSAWFIFVVVLMAEVAFGYYVALQLGYVVGDAISRVANSFFALFSRDPHLAAIGFIWNPLPSLLNLPLLLVWPFWKPIASYGLAGITQSAIFAALSAVTLFVSLRKFGLPAWAQWLFVLLFASNPFIFWYGANGMSESVFGWFLMLVIVQWTIWLSKLNSTRPLILAALGLAMAFLVRYEAVAFSAGVGVATLLYLLAMRTKYPKIESTLLVLFLPVGFAVLVWVGLNFTIMDDPLYFLRSTYSNMEQVNNAASIGASAVMHKWWPTLFFVWERSAVFMIPLGVILLFRILRRELLRFDTLGLLAMALSIPAMQVVMVYQGSSFGWLRFFCYPYLVAVAWLPYEWSRMKGTRIVKWFTPVMAIALVAVSWQLISVMNNPRLAPDEYNALHYNISDILAASELARDVAQRLDADVLSREDAPTILTDSFNAYEIMVNSNYPGQFINSTDRDFEVILQDPPHYGVSYILVPSPEDFGSFNAVNRAYPELYNRGADWAVLERVYPGDWKLFRVLPKSSGRNASTMPST